MEHGLGDNELRQFYRETTTLLKENFNPHFNLYQKTFLQSKLQCFEINFKEPSKYYECIDKLDDKMNLNSSFLRKKLEGAEFIEKECLDKCKVSFNADSNECKDCMKKCAKTLRESCISVYQNFYEQNLSSVPEYKKIK